MDPGAANACCDDACARSKKSSARPTRASAKSKSCARRSRRPSCPEAAATQAERELKRLAALPQHAPDRHLIRTYIEWMAELPWSKATEDKLDLPDRRGRCSTPTTTTSRRSRSASSSSWRCASWLPRRRARSCASSARPVSARRRSAARSPEPWAATSPARRSAACATRRRSAGTAEPTSAPCRGGSCRACDAPARATRSSCSTRSTSWARTFAAIPHRPCSRCSTPSRITPSATTTSRSPSTSPT